MARLALVIVFKILFYILICQSSVYCATTSLSAAGLRSLLARTQLDKFSNAQSSSQQSNQQDEFTDKHVPRLLQLFTTTTTSASVNDTDSSFKPRQSIKQSTQANKQTVVKPSIIIPESEEDDQLGIIKRRKDESTTPFDDTLPGDEEKKEYDQSLSSVSTSTQATINDETGASTTSGSNNNLASNDNVGDLCYLSSGASSLVLTVNEATPVGSVVGIVDVSITIYHDE